MKSNITDCMQPYLINLQGVTVEAQIEARLLGLDFLRCILALGVLCWHYQHFANNDSSIQFIKQQQPLYFLLKIFYSHGGQFRVQAFWCISGFILFSKYGQGIAEKLVSSKKFFIGRLSRIYPLHLVTLFIVAFANLVYFYYHQRYFAYQTNDFISFLKQLLLASNWMGGPHNFNGPIWSLSAEIPVYGIFYIFTRLFGLRASVNYLFISFYILAKWANLTVPVIDCMGYFYSGGLSAMYLQKIETQGGNKSLDFRFFLLVLILLIGLHLLKLPLLKPIKYLVLINMMMICFYYTSRIIKTHPKIQKIIQTMSKLTFSSYLIQFPMQIILVLLFDWLHQDIPFYSISFLLMFISSTLYTSYLSVHYFEKPLQSYIRNKFK
jgi:peptidoglycan/LPS O-acetylase OafA/YrhL